MVAWTVVFHATIETEHASLSEAVQDELLAHARLLEALGPQLGGPRAHTFNGSKHANMKELRFDAAGGVWRVAYAFDPKRTAITPGRERQDWEVAAPVLQTTDRRSGSTL